MGSLSATHNLLLAIASVILWSATQGKIFTIQADYQRNRENHPIWDLTNSSDGKAVILEGKKSLSINFCLRRRSTVSVVDFRFSNGNKTDVVILDIDNTVMGMFQSPANQKNSWNMFLSTGRFPRSSFFEIGWHRLTVKLGTPADGMAVDHIDIDIDDDRMTRDIFRCELTCIPDQTFNVRPNEELTRSSVIVQESYKTSCPEVDNINIPIFNAGIKSYEITAVLPQYRTFSNWRAENTTGCPHLSPFYWSFNNMELTSNSRKVLPASTATLQLSQWHDPYAKVSLFMLVSFRLEGKSKGMVDSEMGTILNIKFKGLTSSVQLQIQYKGRMRDLSDKELKFVTPTKPETEWKTQDFSWTDKDLNLLFIFVSSNSSKPLQLEHLFLQRRPMLPDQTQTIFKSDDTIVEVIFSDFWWLNPDAMSVHLSTGETYNNVSYMRVYRPIPWNSGYAQVFVLYQDGNARLLPVPPEGLDWIPFGSSVIIGQTDPTVVRPYASITDATIDVNSLFIDLQYKDGGFAKLSLISSLTETRVIVSDIVLARNSLDFPFTTFRSMYVAEGNSDVDHVTVNGQYTRHIMDDFGNILGRNFVFHRKCMSRHLNLSPDIYIDIRSTTAGPDSSLLQSESFQQLLLRLQQNRYRMWTPRLRYSYM